DEAHHLEDVAAMHLGAQVSMLGVQRLLSRLEKNGRGLLPTLRSVLFGRDDLLSAASRELAQQGLTDALAAARRAADDVFTRLPVPPQYAGSSGAGGRPRTSPSPPCRSIWRPSSRRACSTGSRRWYSRAPPSRQEETSATSRSGSGSTCRRHGRRYVRSMRRPSTTPRSACLGSRPTSPSRVTTNRVTAPRSRGCSWSWLMRPTAACSSCSRATERCGARRTPCATRSAAGGPCSCRARGSVTT